MIFFVQFFCVFLPPLLNIFASIKSIPFLSFIEPIFAWNVPLVYLIYLKRSLVFPVLLFPSISLHWSLRKAFSSLLTILWNSAFRWVYLSFSPLPFISLLSQLLVRPPQIAILPFCFFLGMVFDNCLQYNVQNIIISDCSHFAFLHFFSMGMVLITASCTMPRTFVYSSLGTLSSRSNPLNVLSLLLYNQKGFDLGYTWMA